MDDEFELVGTITMRVDDFGQLQVVSHVDETSNAAAYSNRDFYFEVAYKENPHVIVANSNMITIRHTAEDKSTVALSLDKNQLVGEGEIKLTANGEFFTKNSTLKIGLYRSANDMLATLIEELEVQTSTDGNFSLDIEQYFSENPEESVDYSYFVEASYKGISKLITSNTVILLHTGE